MSLSVQTDSDSSVSATPETAEAIVVGSGFGGAVAACRLAQAGIRTLVLERGRRYEPNDFPALPPSDRLLPDLKRWTWASDQGLWDVVDLEEVVSIQAAGYGGGSLIYANVHLRPPETVFDARWPKEYQGRALDGYFDLAGYMLDASPITEHPDLSGRLVKTDQLAKVARHLGREETFFYPPLAVSHKAGKNVAGRVQEACNGCGACCSGCANSAKNTLDLNYLAIAESRGAKVVTQCEVVDVEQNRDGTWTLRCFDHLTQVSRTYQSRNVFLCAGAIHSTRLLARARLLPEAAQVQSMVGIGYYPNADAFGVIYDTAHEQRASVGPTITTSTVVWDRDPGNQFFLVQDGGYAPALERLLGTLRAPAWVGRNRLTVAGRVTVGPSTITPLAVPSGPPQILPLLSPLEDLLTAVGAGAFKDVPSQELRRHTTSFVAQLRKALLLPQIVQGTIDRSITNWLRGSRLTSWLRPDGWVARALVYLHKWVLRTVYGTSDDLAERAFDALLAAADLSPSAWADRVLGYGDQAAERRTMLLAMGRDEVPGVLQYDREHDRLIADLDLFHLAPRYAAEEGLMADIALSLGGELRTSPAWAFLGKPVTVHNQGGCPMSADPRFGVTTPDGRVHGCDGLYVLDGSILCTSVGVNPSATITAISERNILQFIRSYKTRQYTGRSSAENELQRHDSDLAWPDSEPNSEGARQYIEQRTAASAWRAHADRQSWQLTPPTGSTPPPTSQPLGLGFREVMQGYYWPTVDPIAPEDPGAYLALETRGRPDFPIILTLDVSVDNLTVFFEDCEHVMKVAGEVSIRLPDENGPKTYKVESGRLDLFVPRVKPYGIRPDQVERMNAQRARAGGYTTQTTDDSSSTQRTMRYALSFRDDRNRPWQIRGIKLIRENPAFDAWRDTSSLFVTLHGPPDAGDTMQASEVKRMPIRGAGAAHVDLDGFLFHQLPSLRISPPDTDPARAVWATLKFATFFFGTLQRIYAPEVNSMLTTLFKPHPNNVRHNPAVLR